MWRGHGRVQIGEAMTMMKINKIAPPRRSPAEFQYEADLKDALSPLLSELLIQAELAGWDRRKAAYCLMFLAAQNVTETKPRSPNGVAAAVRPEEVKHDGSASATVP